MPLINYIGNRQEALAGGIGGFVRGNAPTPPALTFDYLLVGAGMVRGAGIGGSAGGFLSGSAASMSFNTTLDIIVGLGGSGSNDGGSSSIASPSFGYLYAGGANTTFSGYPQGNQEGLGGAPPIGKGGGAGAGQNGINGVAGLSGRGGNGLMWVDGNTYAGGGGGGGDTLYANGAGGTGGGGYGGTGSCSTCLPGQNGVDGTGGGGGGLMQKGGSGIVILRYLTSSLVPPYDNALSGGSLTITGSYAYLTFTGSTQLSYRF